jgi:hypothetical protein
VQHHQVHGHPTQMLPLMLGEANIVMIRRARNPLPPADFGDTGPFSNVPFRWPSKAFRLRGVRFEDHRMGRTAARLPAAI